MEGSKFKERENFSIEEEGGTDLIGVGGGTVREKGKGGGKFGWERPLIGIETISRRFRSRNLDGVNVISPKLTILRGGNEAIQWMEGEGGQSLVQV